ncbi:MFS transporter [Corallococcus macrosporus]|uniref:MFS transporter n=1 Tax=Corallococcus macrosporus TaxID=35 RepID=UPI000312454F|nr:MFS transporter [Corallococcus macrosporus]
MSVPASDSDASGRGTGALWLLRRHPAFRALWGARVISFTGDSLSLVALMLYVAEQTGQALAVSVLLLVGDFAPALLGPLTGAISDRFDLKRVMMLCEVVQGALLALIALTLPPLPVLLVLVAARAIAGQVFQPASRAVVPALVRGEDLEAANASVGFGTQAAEALGPLLAAAMFPLVGLRGVLLVDAASFLLSAVLLRALPSVSPARERDAPPVSLFRQARDGLLYLWRARVARVVALGFCAVVAFNGVDDVALVLLAKDTFQAGDSAVGLLLGAVGLGLVAGYALMARLGAGAAMPVMLVLGFAVSSVGNLLTGLAWAVSAALAMQAVRGVGIAAMDVACHTLIQRWVPAGMRGRVFGNLYGAIGVAAGLSYVAGGLLLDATSAPVTLLVAGAGGTLATLVVAWRLPGALRAEAATRAPD